VLQHRHTPFAIISQLHSQQSKQHWQHMAPSRVHCTLQIPQSIERQRFWNITHAAASSHMQ
jgi:hypothetical protein